MIKFQGDFIVVYSLAVLGAELLLAVGGPIELAADRAGALTVEMVPTLGFPPFLLSGGIGPDALPALARFAHPRWAGVDLNSRFEAAPGLKRTDLLASFIEKFRKLTSNPLTSPNP